MYWREVIWLTTILASIYGQLVSVDVDRDTINNDESGAVTEIINTNPNVDDVNPVVPFEDEETGESNVDSQEPSTEDVESQPDASVDSQENNEDSEHNSNEEGASSPETIPETSEETQNPTPEINSTEESDTNENGADGEPSSETDQTDSNEGINRSSEESRETNEIEVEGGLVQGHLLHGDTGIISYIDIPYGNFSSYFEAPSKPATWENVHSVTEHDKRCPQVNEDGVPVGDLDCLTLSVFTPSNVENAAVLFYIHEGDFHTGSGNSMIYGPEHLVTKGVILVLPNYRVGPLGFLCMKNEIAPGNAGLKDLALALEWTYNNIAVFGGNSSKIVISGDGKSGALAGYLALSAKSKGFISGVITESGSVLAPWALDRDPLATAAQFEEILDESITNDVEVEKLVSAGRDINFRPCIETGEDAFINISSWGILQTEKLDIPFMIGSANNAGKRETVDHTNESLADLNEHFIQFLPNDLHFDQEWKRNEISDKIRQQYFGDDVIDTDHLQEISLCHTDAYYLGPALRMARLLAEAGAKVYFYEFSYMGELNRESVSMNTTLQGAARSDLIGYVFTQDGVLPHDGSEEERMLDVITDLWVSFMQTGVPAASGVNWLEFEKAEAPYEAWLSIDNDVTPKTGLHVERLTLWTQIYEDHFVERDLAVDIKASIFLILLAAFIQFRRF